MLKFKKKFVLFELPLLKRCVSVACSDAGHERGCSGLHRGQQVPRPRLQGPPGQEAILHRLSRLGPLRGHHEVYRRP